MSGLQIPTVLTLYPAPNQEPAHTATQQGDFIIAISLQRGSEMKTFEVWKHAKSGLKKGWIAERKKMAAKIMLACRYL